MATINYWGLSGIKDSVTVALTVTIDDLITAIAADEGLSTQYYTISLLNNPSVNDLIYGDSSSTLADLGIVDGDTILCTTNQAGSKQDRQIQKLEIAAVARAADGNARATYDITELPTQYNGNDIIDNPNVGGLVEGRPWTAAPALPTILTDNLFMRLEASEYSGSGAWEDLQGSNDATVNGATWSSADGGIFDLDGVNDTISIPHVASLSLSTSASRTVQVWVKFDSIGTSGQQIPVIGKLSSGYGYDGYWAGLYNGGGLLRATTNGTGIQKVTDSTLTVITDTWYLFTFISRITNTAGSTKVYINSTEYISTAHGTDSYSESNPLYLGYIGSGVGSLYLNGKIGACYFYTDELTAQEISDNYDATKTRYGL